MWDKHVQEVAASVGISDLPAACDAANGSYASFKKSASTAVREWDIHAGGAFFCFTTDHPCKIPAYVGPGCNKLPQHLAALLGRSSDSTY